MKQLKVGDKSVYSTHNKLSLLYHPFLPKQCFDHAQHPLDYMFFSHF
jgi:hypothetical protein